MAEVRTGVSGVPPAPERAGRPVVVGVDGSSGSVAALRWAADYAALTGSSLHAVIAWEHDTGFGFQLRGGTLHDEARHRLEQAVHKAIGAGADRVVLEVVEGRPEEVLVQASRGAGLLVVGERGYAGVAGLLLGHCGEACMRHAACTTVLVRGDGH
ncbi:MAG: universal stress protein [Actinomycetota bacterium]|nr:universal stress protein [Actinomycetota bacterium]